MALSGADGGHSLPEMAQRDLDAALQLLADRAQYITGASGAAIALRRDGRNDMLCRASAGSNAPELGALLSTEFGLSGESVRTRRLLRCDDAERDARVNREVCRQMGIASVLVMPVVNDDQVLGVFELFSGKANAFGERDLSAVQRLSEMVETAVRLSQAIERLPEQLKAEPALAQGRAEVYEGQFLSDLVVEEPETPAELASDVLSTVQAMPAEAATSEIVPAPAASVAKSSTPEAVAPQPPSPAASTAPDSVASEPSSPLPSTSAKKPLFWSAALDLDTEAPKTAESDQSHVPPVLRGLQKCMACGFPVSAGRMLCVECEEKKWRGQLRTSQSGARGPAAKTLASVQKPVPTEAARPSLQAFAAAAPAAAKASTVAPGAAPALVPKTTAPAVSPAVTESKKTTDTPTPLSVSAEPLRLVQASEQGATVSAPDLVFSAGLEPSQSWLSRNKYILGVLLAIAAAAAAVFFLRS